MDSTQTTKKPETTKEKTREEIAADKSFKNLYPFLRNFWHVNVNDPFEDNWHIRFLCEVLDDYVKAIVSRRKIEDLIINVPPGTSKSTIVHQMFPAFLWLHAPWAVIIGSSYQIDLSIKNARLSKAIIYSERYRNWFGPLFEPLHGAQFSMTKDTEKLYINNFGGQRISTSTRGKITGEHAHVILRDDPMDPFSAESEAYRKQEKRFNDTTLSNRKKNAKNVPTITSMQRVHAQDTTGRDLKKDVGRGKIRHICLPARISPKVKPERVRKFYINGLMDAGRLGEEELDDYKIALGSYGFAGQYQQSPAPPGGGMIKTKWFKEYDRIPAGPSSATHFYLDGAYTKNEENDASGILGGRVTNNDLYLTSWESVHMEFPDLVRWIPKHMARNGASVHSALIVELKANGHSVLQELRRYTDLNVIGHTPEGIDKPARTRLMTPTYEAGRVWTPSAEPWVEPFTGQLEVFPTSDVDEAVDCLNGLTLKLLLSSPEESSGMRGFR